MKQVKTLIIPAAGFGTRFLPATKTTPKGMLPVLNKPIVQYVVEEAVEAGIENIIFVTGPAKKTMEDHFDCVPALEKHLKYFKKKEYLEKIDRLSMMANFIYIRQKHFYGSGYPVLECAHLIKDEPFAVAWEDEFYVSRPSRFVQLIKTYNKYQAPVLTSCIGDDEATRRCGVLTGEEVEKSVIKMDKLIEKPGPKKTKSRIITTGGYILTPGALEAVRSLSKKIKKTQELYITEAFSEMIKQGHPVYGKIVKGEFIDCNNPLEWIKSNIKMGLKDPKIKTELKKYLKAL